MTEPNHPRDGHSDAALAKLVKARLTVSLLLSAAMVLMFGFLNALDDDGTVASHGPLPCPNAPKTAGAVFSPLRSSPNVAARMPASH